MIFNIKEYNPIPVVMSKKNDSLSGVTFLINPESIQEVVKSNLDSTQLVNSNLPRQIGSGTKGREITFTLLLHGMFSYTGQNTRKNTFSESSIASKLSGVAQLVPFASNVVRGIESIADLLNKNLLTNADYLLDTKNKKTKMDIDNTITTLFSFQVPPDGRTTLVPIIMLGYPAFSGMDFYITNIQVTRKFWDKQLNTQFAEVQISLVQIGSDGIIGKFAPDPFVVTKK